VKNSWGTSAAAVGTCGSGGSERVAGGGQLVVVRQQVVDNVGHVLGNLFQRIYHLLSQPRDPGASADQLESTIRQLEHFLQLVLDYVSPISLTLDYVSAAEIAQSLARQVSDRIGAHVRTGAELPMEGRLLIDPGRLARCFALLATRLVENGSNSKGIELQATIRPAAGVLLLWLDIPAGLVLPCSSVSEMHWAVAEKFLEMHGGSLQAKPGPSGDVRWEITIPLQS